jgi:hypothetical protein
MPPEARQVAFPGPLCAWLGSGASRLDFRHYAASG